MRNKISFKNISYLIAIVSLVSFLFMETRAQSVPLNGPTPWEVIGNTFSKPNVNVQIGKKEYEWYGSGDVNNDEIINQEDADIILGSSNDMADVDGDGTPGTQLDKDKLTEFLNGNIDYLPGHWNELKTPEERISWLEKMISINDALAPGLGNGWICANYINQMTFEFFGLSNFEEFFNGSSVGYSDEYIARYNLPMYHFAATNTNNVPHSVGGVLVGKRVSPDSVSNNPLEFEDFYFIGYNNDDRVYPGNFNMDPNHPVRMNLRAYVRNPITGDTSCQFIQNIVEWDLNNGEATLIDYNDELLIIENPNIIVVNAGNLEDIIVNGGDVSPADTSLIPEILENLGFNAIPDTTKENTTLPINLTYTNKDTTWNSDSTSFSFYRGFYAWIYSGGVTKWDTTSHKITVYNLIGPYTKVHVGGLDSLVVDGEGFPPGFHFTPEVLDSLGYNAIPDTTKEYTNLPINLTYTDKDTIWNPEKTSYSFDRKFDGWLYSFADTTRDSTTQNIRIDNVTGVNDNKNTIPKNFKLYRNYPNPFNPNTLIKYQIPELSFVTLKVYDVLGNEIAKLVSDEKPIGSYEVEFKATNLPSGIYFYRLQTGSFVETKKMILLK